MKIASFNINNVNKRLDTLLDGLGRSQPDVACLQELMAESGAFPIEAIEAAGYGAAWVGQRTWNGVAILARDQTPVRTRRRLPGDPSDIEARHVEAAVDGVLVASIYLPNGNPNPGPKFDYKLAWFERLIAHAASLQAARVPVVLAGDYNVVPTETDIYQPNRWKRDALVSPQAPRGFRSTARRWLDRRVAYSPSSRPVVDLMVLSSPAMERRQRLAPGPPVALAGPSGRADRRRRGSLGARRSRRERPCAGLDRARPLMAKDHPVTPDGRYFVMRGRLWRMSDPRVDTDERERLVAELMTARRAVAAARKRTDEAAEVDAHDAVDRVKRQLGERGPVWWSDGAPDLNRHMARNTPYAGWWAKTQRRVGQG